MRALFTRITARPRTDRNAVRFHKRGGQVCTAACRAAAHRDRTATAALRARA